MMYAIQHEFHFFVIDHFLDVFCRETAGNNSERKVSYLCGLFLFSLLSFRSKEFCLYLCVLDWFWKFANQYVPEPFERQDNLVNMEILILLCISSPAYLFYPVHKHNITLARIHTRTHACTHARTHARINALGNTVVNFQMTDVAWCWMMAIQRVAPPTLSTPATFP